MKTKKIIVIVFVCAITCGIVILKNNHTDSTSNLVMSNIEALADGENNDVIYANSSKTSTKLYEEVLCVGKPPEDTPPEFQVQWDDEITESIIRETECIGQGTTVCYPSSDLLSYRTYYVSCKL
jgi:hypothetical protein